MGSKILQRLVFRQAFPIFTLNTLTISHNLTYIGKPVLPNINCLTFRNYAKSKDKGKGKKGKGGKVEINESMIAEVVPIEKLKTRCGNAIEVMKEDFAKHLSLRSTTGSLETLAVHHSGNEYELQELAQVLRKNPKTVIINFSSFPQAIPDVLKAIHNSGLNLNPQQDGTKLYIPVPKVTKEHREGLAKNAKILYYKCRDTLKDVQNDFLKKTKQQKTAGVSEDLIFNINKQITAMCGDYNIEAKTIFDLKHKELLGN